MYVTKLSISNLRSIESAEIGFCHPGSDDPPDIPNVTLLLGDNGVGKTSILRAIALAVLSPVIESSGFAPYNLVRRTLTGVAERADVCAHILLHAQDLEHAGDKTPVEVDVGTVIQRRHDLESVRPDERPGEVWEGMFIEQSAAFLMVGYSAGRRVEGAASFDSGARAKSRRVRFQRVAGLFEEGVTLTPLGAWLPRYRGENPERHKQVIDLMNRLLPEGTRILEEMERDEYVFEHNGAKIPFAAMSDGYRAYIGWVADLLYHICMGAPRGQKLVDNRGIVLVDEIDLHLHPAWQREVVPQLARALPKLQFVLTTHSPIVAGTLQAKNIRLIAPDETGASTIEQLDERIHGLNADQILVSSYFGLDSTRAPDAVDELRALSQEARHGDQDAVRQFLRKLAASSDSWGADELAEAPRTANTSPPRTRDPGRSAAKGVEVGTGTRISVRSTARTPTSGSQSAGSGRSEGASGGRTGGDRVQSGGASAARSGSLSRKSSSAGTKSGAATVSSGASRSTSTKSSGVTARGSKASSKSSGGSRKSTPSGASTKSGGGSTKNSRSGDSGIKGSAANGKTGGGSSKSSGAGTKSGGRSSKGSAPKSGGRGA